MALYIPGVIYRNLNTRMARIGAVDLSGDINLDDAALSQKLNSVNYVAFHGVVDNTTVTTVYIKEDATIQNKTALMRTMLTQVKKPSASILVVTHTPIKGRILEKITTISNVSANIFLYDPTTNVNVPQHIIADPAEIKEFCNRWYTQPDKFPKILSTDPQAVWLDLKPGMVVKVVRASESACSAIVYRLCV